tara:strand:- start:237 stop:1028 length:792 start_codon:yes stop_codon:yes gene_type:complete
MEIPKIKRVVDPEDNYKPKKKIHPNLPNVQGFGGGAVVLMISPIKTGKSTVISNLMLSNDCYGQTANGEYYFDETTIISPSIGNCITSRFLREAFDVYDYYSDDIIQGIIDKQKSYKKSEQPEIAILLDDCLGLLPLNSKVNALSSRARHLNIRLLLFSTQKFMGSVSPVVRANATNIIVGSPFPNFRELNAIAESYGDMFGGKENFLKIYKLATPNRFDFLHLDLQENPPLAYHNFEKVIAIGDKIINDNNINDNNINENEI